MLSRLTRSSASSASSTIRQLARRSLTTASRPAAYVQASMSAPTKHQLFATTNFSVSGASGLYDRARPSYPTEAIQSILSRLPPPSSQSSSPGEGALIVELGAGTGLFTRGLLAALLAPDSPYKGRVRKVLAVEPSEGMRVGFEKGLERSGLGRDEQGRVGGEGGVEVEIVDGTFEEIPVGEGEADLVVIAQAFHWVGHNGGPAVEEIGRVLKPGATWAKIWNLEDQSTAWVKQLRDAYEKYEEDTPQYRHNYWHHIWTLPSFTSLFSSPEKHETFTRALPTNPDRVVDRVFSKSYITALSEEERKKLERELRAIVERGEGKKWISQEEGEFEYPYATDLFTTVRK